MPLQSITIDCFYCGTSFTQPTAQKQLSKYCSSSCAKSASHEMMRQRTGIVAWSICVECGERFEYLNRQGGLPKYCEECHGRLHRAESLATIGEVSIPPEQLALF